MNEFEKKLDFIESLIIATYLYDVLDPNVSARTRMEKTKEYELLKAIKQDLIELEQFKRERNNNE